MKNTTKKFEAYLSKTQGEIGKLKKETRIKEGKEDLASRLLENWEQINPKKVSDDQIQLINNKENNKYWVICIDKRPVDKIISLNYYLENEPGNIDYRKERNFFPPIFPEKKKAKIKKAFEIFHLYHEKLENRGLTKKGWVYFTNTSKKQIKKDVLNGEIEEKIKKTSPNEKIISCY
jgi:hypothetical protein